jgi:uncharacterized protein (DUF608 family)
MVAMKQMITNQKMQQSGMALGGIGTGTVEINQNGELQNWHIFNRGEWASREAEKQRLEDLYDYNRQVLPFYIRTKQGEALPKVRKLAQDRDAGEFRSVMYSWHKEVQEIQYEPGFPIANLRYVDDGLPVRVRAEFASPFVPLDSRVSGTPGFYATFFIENSSEEPVEVSLLGKLKNPVNRGLANRNLRNRLHRGEDHLAITMDSDSTGAQPQNGSISFSVSGGETSYIQGDYAAYFANFVLGGAFGVTEQSYLFDFRETGKLPNLGRQTYPQEIIRLSDEELEQMSEEQLEAVLAQILMLASSNPPYRRIMEIDPALLADRAGKLKFIRVIRKQIREIQQDAEGQEAWGDAALCSTLTLLPGECSEIRFVVSWFFPNHYSEQGRFVGHQYANWFRDAQEVNAYMNAQADELLGKVRGFVQTLGTSDAPASFVRHWFNQLNTVIKSSWWTKAGDFAIWEGYGSCGFHTTDITYQGSFNLLALFPDLQLGQMELGARFQRADGRVHHFFTPDLRSVDDGFDRVDMNPQYVLLVCRDYLWTGDIGYVHRLWPSIVKAMDSIAQLDSDGDGLPDTETGSNTYDAWHFRGTPSYISSLWLAALMAASRLAEDLGEWELQAKWQAILAAGQQSFRQKLWNGEYFSLWVEDDTRDECCMADQLDGQWFAQLIGLGDFLPRTQIRDALMAVLKYNYHPETGLINAVYPKTAKPTLYTHRNVQAEANWSGIEFAFASALLEYGLPEEAAAVSDNVDERYRRAGRIFNHEECGNHYYRAMAGWALLLSVTGFKLDVPRSTVTFAPTSESLEAPWFAPSGYGRFVCRPGMFELHSVAGEISFQTLVLAGRYAHEPVRVQVNGETVGCECAFVADGEHTMLTFAKKLTLRSGQTLHVSQEQER